MYICNYCKRNFKNKYEVCPNCAGKTLSLVSESKYLTTLGREDGLVDLLIDPDDYSNYFIDFEIY